jgi:hypothetical protein
MVASADLWLCWSSWRPRQHPEWIRYFSTPIPSIHLAHQPAHFTITSAGSRYAASSESKPSITPAWACEDLPLM